jgi:hypothetical protein
MALRQERRWPAVKPRRLGLPFTDIVRTSSTFTSKSSSMA